ncbi:threonine synthase [Helicobacter saguini]|uniref:Threonine synthase n=1 Tax=Helicobacter saguini TaxID=1548018 RepID=A0A347VT77_9HELI|nr:threonine synthase [Helicobacter saguini]MWV62207.1 threonine synthase [Helicobacter saguini]MWV67120.1 threonine synthase [Helicobacter saguini]MWV69470.1 threonine synthase [Helicobacter saguini]MWV70977.1 threonine synthase [Helicobacter saguini]TLD92937.1 threonine synthase [Helicobacter saguini]
MQDSKKDSNLKHFLAQTRSEKPTNKDFVDAILSPSAEFGGLYTFREIKPFSQNELESIYNADYTDICKRVFKQLNIDLDSKMLDYALESYAHFRDQNIAPLVQLEPHLYALELYHGPTFAFKDMALQPFSRLLDSIARAQNRHFLILSATSGDTGPATLSGFAGSQNIKAICIYPRGGTSVVQRLQMTTQSAPNLKVFGINGDFDAAQNALKNLLKNRHFIESLGKKGYELSAANSVNIARIAFQIVYYFVIAKELFKKKVTKFSVIVPSGNFGNALGCYYAKKLGLNITKICIASNPNDILTQFFTTGSYDISNKKLIMSYSPAMDILKSSNIERLLFDYFGAARTRELMESLEKDSKFCLKKAELVRLQELFEARSFSDKECLQGIKEAFENGYVLDPHTSNAFLFAKFREDSMESKNADSNVMLSGAKHPDSRDSKKDSKEVQVIISTAHFSKFAKNVLLALSALDSNLSAKIIESMDEKNALDKIVNLINSKLHKNIKLDSKITELFSKKEIHNKTYEISQLENSILSWV